MDQQETANQRQSSSWWQLMAQNFPWRQFILGALIPMAIFYVFKHLDRRLTGSLLAGGWGLGVVVATYWRSRQVDPFAGLAVALTAIQLIVTLITRNPDLYLASAAIDSALYGLLFLGSLLWRRPLIQILAESVNPEMGSIEFRRSRLYRSAWQILTALWGIVNLLTVVVLIMSQLWLPLEAFLIVRTASGTPLSVAMLAFSYWFPGWYWSRARGKSRLASA